VMPLMRWSTQSHHAFELSAAAYNEAPGYGGYVGGAPGGYYSYFSGGYLGGPSGPPQSPGIGLNGDPRYGLYNEAPGYGG
jgi:hypothetical protein